MSVNEIRTLMILPKELRDELKKHAQDRLRLLLILRDFRDELKGKDESVMEMYAEAGALLHLSPSRMAHLVGTLRAYSEENLRYWLNNGVTWCSIEAINSLEANDMLNATPAQIFTEAIDPGNAEGKTMTKEEIILFALGHKERPALSWRVDNLFAKLANVLKLPDDKAAELYQIIRRYLHDNQVQL